MYAVDGYIRSNPALRVANARAIGMIRQLSLDQVRVIQETNSVRDTLKN